MRNKTKSTAKEIEMPAMFRSYYLGNAKSYIETSVDTIQQLADQERNVTLRHAASELRNVLEELETCMAK